MASDEKIPPDLKIPTLNPNPEDQRLVEELFSTATAEQVAAYRRLTGDFASHVTAACVAHIADTGTASDGPLMKLERSVMGGIVIGESIGVNTAVDAYNGFLLGMGSQEL